MLNNACVSYLTSLNTLTPFFEKVASKQAPVSSPAELLQLVLSKRFRKSPVSIQAKRDLLAAITRIWQGNQPLRFWALFGGYKLSSIASAPYPDWAELFHLRYMSEVMCHIAAAYPPGVELVYRSDGPIIQYINGYPPEGLRSYAERFLSYIAWFNKGLASLPIKISYEDVVASRTVGHLESEINSLVPEVTHAFYKLSEAEREVLLRKSERNRFWADSHASISDRRALSTRSLLRDMAFLRADKAYIASCMTDGIPLIFRRGNGDYLHYATAKGTIVQFWVGTGCVFVTTSGEWSTQILSSMQYAQAHRRPEFVHVRMNKDGPTLPSLPVILCTHANT